MTFKVGGPSPFGGVPESQSRNLAKEPLLEKLNASGDGAFRVIERYLAEIGCGFHTDGAHTREVAERIQVLLRHNNRDVRMAAEAAKTKIIESAPASLNAHLWFKAGTKLESPSGVEPISPPIPATALLSASHVFSRNQGPEELLRRLSPEADAIILIPHVLDEINRGDHENGVHTVEVVSRLGELLKHDNSTISSLAREILGKMAINRRELLSEAGISPLSV